MPRKIRLTDENLLKAIKSKKEEIQKDYDKALKDFNDNVLYQFAWKAEDIYKNAVWLSLLNDIEKARTTNPDVTVDELYTYYERDIFGSSAKLMDRSTGQLHSYTSLWKKEVTVDLLNWMANPDTFYVF